MRTHSPSQEAWSRDGPALQPELAAQITYIMDTDIVSIRAGVATLDAIKNHISAAVPTQPAGWVPEISEGEMYVRRPPTRVF